MRDIDITSRDLYGHITFGFKKNSQISSSIEILIQKITTLLMSSSKETYFNSIIGGDILGAGKFNLSPDGQDDFRVNLTTSIDTITKKIQADEIVQNVLTADRLKTISLQDLVYDTKTASVYVSLLVISNSTQKIIKLPVK